MKTTKELLEDRVNVLAEDIRNSGLPLRAYLKENALEIVGGAALLTSGGPTISVKDGKIYGHWTGVEIVKDIR